MGLEIEIEGDSEPAVALALLKLIMNAEGKDESGADADWILATYARCFAAVTGELTPAAEEAGGDEEEDEEDDDEELEDNLRNPA
jgi:hypothetical protein